MRNPTTRAVALSVAALLLLSAGPAAAQKWRTVNSSRQVWNEKQLDVRVDYAAGRLSVAPSESPLLYQVELRYDESVFTPVTEYSPEAGRLRVAVRGQRDGIRMKNIGREARASLSLSPTVPLDLEMSFGAGEANLDLGGLSLRRLDLSTGASETRVSFSAPNRAAADRIDLRAGVSDFVATGLGNANASRFTFEGGVGSTTLDFGGSWSRNASGSIHIGMGSLDLRFPRSLGVKIVKNSFLTKFESSGLVKRGDAFYSRNWDTAEHQLTLTIDAGMGSIDVGWID